MNAMQMDLGWENVHLFVQGETSLIGFDERRGCFYRLGSLNAFSSPADLFVEEFQLETKISERVLRLFLNRNETILTVETNDNLHFVSLPKTPWKKVVQCPVERFPSSKSKETLRLNFLWLTEKDFLVFSLAKSPSIYHCDRYSLDFDRQWKFVHHDSYSLPTSTEEVLFKETLPFAERTNFLQIDFTEKFIEETKFFFVFVYKFNGDIFFLQLNSTRFHLRSKSSKELWKRFRGPLKLSPSRSDNFGALSPCTRLHCWTSEERILVLTVNASSVDQFLFLSDDEDEDEEYSLFLVDRIVFSRPRAERGIRSIHLDRTLLNVYYLLDSSAKLFAVEIRWITDLYQRKDSTKIEEIPLQNDFSSSSSPSSTIHSFSTIENHFQGKLFLLVQQNNSSSRKILFVCPRRSTLKKNSAQGETPRRTVSLRSSTLRSRGDFGERVRTILKRDEPSSSPSGGWTEELFSQQIGDAVLRQEQARRELENKEIFFADYRQTQRIAAKELLEVFRSSDMKFLSLVERFHQEVERLANLRAQWKKSSSAVDEPLARPPPTSSNEKVCLQLQIQMKYLREKLCQMENRLMERRPEEERRANPLDAKSIQKFGQVIGYYQEEIFRMKMRFEDLRTDDDE